MEFSIPGSMVPRPRNLHLATTDVDEDTNEDNLDKLFSIIQKLITIVISRNCLMCPVIIYIGI